MSVRITDRFEWDSPLVPAILLVTVLSATWFLFSTYRLAFSVALPEVLTTTSASYTDVSLLFGGLFVGYASGQFPAGIVADRVGVWPVHLGSSLIASVALASIALASSYVHVFTALLFVGCGIGGVRSVSQIAVSSTIPDRLEGRALGLLTAAEPLSYVIGPVVIVFLLESYGLFTAPVVLALVPLPFVGLVYVSRVDPPVEHGVAPTLSFWTAVTVLRTQIRTRKTALILAFGAVFSTTTNALIAILPWYLVETTPLSLTHGSVYAGLLFGLGAGGAVVGGIARDRIGAIPVLVSGFVVAAGTLCLFALASGVTHILTALGVFSLALNSVLPARDRVINVHATTCSDSHTGAMIGGFRSLCYLLGGIGAVLVGLIAAQFGAMAGFACLIVSLAVGGCCALFLGRTSGEHY